MGRDTYDDCPFIVLTETKFSLRCIPVWIGTLLISCKWVRAGRVEAGIFDWLRD